MSVPLTPGAIEEFLTGREVYRRTDFLLLRNAGKQALVQVTKDGTGSLFEKVIDLLVLALPSQVRAVEAPDLDVANATAMARAAQPLLDPEATTYVFTGKFEHVNFIYRPALLEIRVVEVVPPEPPKLLAMAEQVIEYDEDLPPIALVLDSVDLRELTRAQAPGDVLLPCRGAIRDAEELGAHAEFLDTRPQVVTDWTLLGCERSRQFYLHFYDEEPHRVDICPRTRRDSDLPTLTKCCLRERGIGYQDGTAEVPWGANLDEVRSALRRLAGLASPAGVSEERVAP